MTVEKVTYPTESINKVLTYLGDRPYKEVAQLIHILQSGEIVKPKPAEPVKPAKPKPNG
jgi:hypothetical protein